jgi:hypothetical protein
MKINKVSAVLRMNVKLDDFEFVHFEASVELQSTRKKETVKMLFGEAWNIVENEIANKVKTARTHKKKK